MTPDQSLLAAKIHAGALFLRFNSGGNLGPDPPFAGAMYRSLRVVLGQLWDIARNHIAVIDDAPCSELWLGFRLRSNPDKRVDAICCIDANGVVRLEWGQDGQKLTRNVTADVSDWPSGWFAPFFVLSCD